MMQDTLSYSPPDFKSPLLADAEAARFLPAPCDGDAPKSFHATSNHPEYILLETGVRQPAAHRPNLQAGQYPVVLNPALPPGVGTRSPGGLSYREAQLLMEIIADCHRLSSLDRVEINPILDKQNQTATVAVDLLASLLGKSIL